MVFLIIHQSEYLILKKMKLYLMRESSSNSTSIISKLSKNMLKIRIIAFSLMFLISMVYLGIGISSVIDEKSQVDSFFEQENITKFKVEIPTRDGSHIATHIYMDSSVVDFSNKTVPTIIYIAGANNGKTHRLEQKYQLLKNGFAIVAMDQRGHHESGGYFSFYGHEQYDISDVITYLETEYMQLNTTHIGLIGMSLGGGAAVAAQALDDRIHVSSIYHPLSNLTDYFDVIGVDLSALAGFMPGFQSTSIVNSGSDWDSIINETWHYRSVINYVNQTNTKNLLLLHGSKDHEIRPVNSENICNRADPLGNRDDIQFILRDGLGHGGNEKSTVSSKLTVAWFLYYYYNNSIDVTQLETSIDYIEHYSWNYPSTGSYSEDFLISAAILLVSFFILCADYHPKSSKIDVINKKQSNFKQINSNQDCMGQDGMKHQDNLYDSSFKIFVLRSLAMFMGFMIVLLYCYLMNPSLIYAIIFYPPLVVIPFLVLVPSKLFNITSNDKKNIPVYMKYVSEVVISFFSVDNIKSCLRNLLIFALPFIYYFIIINIGADLTNNDVRMPEILVAIRTIFMISLAFSIPFVLMQDIHPKYSILIPIPYFISIVIITLVFQIPEIAFLKIWGFNLIVALVFSVLFLIIYLIGYVLQKLIVKNITSLTVTLGTIISSLLWLRMMRIF